MELPACAHPMNWMSTCDAEIFFGFAGGSAEAESAAPCVAPAPAGAVMPPFAPLPFAAPAPPVASLVVDVPGVAGVVGLDVLAAETALLAFAPSTFAVARGDAADSGSAEDCVPPPHPSVMPPKLSVMGAANAANAAKRRANATDACVSAFMV